MSFEPNYVREGHKYEESAGLLFITFGMAQSYISCVGSLESILCNKNEYSSVCDCTGWLRPLFRKSKEQKEANEIGFN